MPVFFRHSCDVISGLFSEPGCSIRTARGTKNFDFIFIFFWQPVQIHIHVHMHLAGTSMCQRCLLPDEIPSAPNSPSQASALRRTVQIDCQTLERRFLQAKAKYAAQNYGILYPKQISFGYQDYFNKDYIVSIRHVYKSHCSIKKLAFAKETV